jgi:alpha-tubulin suppressor-like RCC1 family protein
MKFHASATEPLESLTTFLAKHGIPCLIGLFGAATLVVQAANPSPSSVIVWGTLSDSFPWNGLSDVVAVDAGEQHAVVLKSDGTVGCFGNCGGYIAPTNNNIVAVSSGLAYMLALRSNGTVVAWASPWSVSEGGEQVPAGLTGVMAIDAGIDLSIALKEDGTLIRWGQNGTPLPVGLSNIIAVSINSEANPGPGQPNYFHALALRNDGTVVTWGRNDYGENSIPAGLNNVTAIAAGAYHHLALKGDGTVVAWGGKNAAIRTPPPGLSNVVAIAAGRGHNLALKSDGTVVAWKDPSDDIYGAGTVPPGLSNVVAISAGRFYSVALTRVSAPVIIRQSVSITDRQGNGGTFSVEAGGTPPLTFQWQKGETDIPGATNGIFSYSPEFAAAGDYRVIVRNDSGSVTSQVCTLTIVPWIQIISQPQNATVNAGSDVTLFVVAVGSSPLTYQWRRNDFDLVGENSDSLNLTNVQTEAGTYSVLVSSHGLTVESEPATLIVNGNILPAIVTPPRSETLFIGAKMVFKVVATGAEPLRYRWQKDGNDIVGQTNTTLPFDSVHSVDAGSYLVVVSNDAGTNTSPPALLTITSRILNLAPPSTVVSVQGPILPAGLTDIVAIAAAARHSLALKSNGTVVAWGDSYLPFYGQNTYSPPLGLSNVVGIAAGYGSGFSEHSLALKDDGTVVSWSGVSLPSAPTVPTDLFGVIAIAAGERHGLALKANGKVVSWGDSIARVPIGLRNVIAISAGGRRSLALRTDGSVAAWGDLGAPALFNSLTDVSAVAAGRTHIMALRSDGAIVDYFGGSAPTNSALGGISNVVAIAAGDSHSLVLKNDGTVTGWNSAQLPEGLTNVTAISGGRGYSLLLTTNPPAPRWKEQWLRTHSYCRHLSLFQDMSWRSLTTYRGHTLQ